MSQFEMIQHLMNNPQLIRNIALVAHVDHGKTTLSDSLLVAAGLLAPMTAGEARALDFLPEEQRRGITMKTANISLILEHNDQKYLINLIDSPGHVDFSGKVARALRISDGAIVVIDAVEQIMAQTETVLQQCLTEGVKPLLFINKIDRLITELKANPQEIAEKLEIIYNNFNSLIQKFSKDKDIPPWQVKPQDGSVCFGSALHRWGISIPISKNSGFTFDTIYNHYKEGTQKKLADILPIQKPVIDMIVKHLPNPQKAQNYRINQIWQGDKTSEQAKAMKDLASSKETPIVFGTSKIVHDKHAGPLLIGRIFSGIIKTNMQLHLINAKKTGNIQNIYLLMGNDKKQLVEAPAGNIVAVSGLGEVHPGETIIDPSIKGMVPFEDIKYVANPVVSIAIEPKMLRDLSELKELLEKYDLEDPNLSVSIDEKTGEILLMGLGELHLETVVQDISKDIECTASDPIVLIVERIDHPSSLITKKQFGTIVQLKVMPSSQENISLKDSSQKEKNEKIIDIPPYNNRIILDVDLWGKLSDGTREHILTGLKNALRKGPINKKPVYGVTIYLKNFETEGKEKFEYTIPVVRNTVWEALREAEISIQEPIYSIQITTPSKYLGKITSIITKRRGKIEDIRTEQDLVVISGYLPVAEVINIAHELRSQTEGRAFWQMKFERFEKRK
ncbi:MAG: GTP-binding protein [Asgard group archaeon]|nr:GTP-binding protein [Asgard group archaeon]